MGFEVSFAFAAFVAGILTILAPCVIPVLPIVIGRGSDNPSKYKPLVITISLMASAFIFGLLLRFSTTLIGIPEDVFTWIAGLILIGFGFSFIDPRIWDWFSIKSGLGNSSNRFLAKSTKHGGLIGDALIGLSLGPVFTSCSPTYGIIIGIALSGEFAVASSYLFIYTIGLGLMMLLVAYGGQKVVSKLGWATDPHGIFRKVLGTIFLLIGIGIITGFDKTIEGWLVDSPFYEWIINIESNLNS